MESSKLFLAISYVAYKTDAYICTAWLSACENVHVCADTATQGKKTLYVHSFQSLGMQQAHGMSSEINV